MADTQGIERILRHAAVMAATAPSIFNTQPWRWQVGGGRLLLWADHDRRLLVADPDGRMLTVSCGVSLHHARTALAASGQEAVVSRLPDPIDPDLLATIDLTGPHEPDPAEITLYRAIPRRRTDRRAFGPEPVPEGVADQLVLAAQAQGARLHLVHRDQLAQLALAAVEASTVQLNDPDYRRELIQWTHRPAWSADGVPTTTAVTSTPRHVPVRPFAPFGGPVLDAGPHTDLGALYAIIFTGQDGPMDWLRAGEALSAVLLTATGQGLGTAPISDITELSTTRERLAGMLPEFGVPQLAARIGHAPATPVPSAPRRPRNEVIFP